MTLEKLLKGNPFIEYCFRMTSFALRPIRGKLNWIPLLRRFDASSVHRRPYGATICFRPT
jgi:hypothetical protein